MNTIGSSHEHSVRTSAAGSSRVLQTACAVVCESVLANHYPDSVSSLSCFLEATVAAFSIDTCTHYCRSNAHRSMALVDKTASKLPALDTSAEVADAQDLNLFIQCGAGSSNTFRYRDDTVYMKSACG